MLFNPARYDVPAKFGKAHKTDAIFLLSLIALLMLADSLFEATRASAVAQRRVRTSWTGCYHGMPFGVMRLRRSWGVNVLTTVSTAARAVAVRWIPKSGASSPK